LLRYKPETGEVDVLATGAAFANGVAVVGADETSVLYTSTFEAAVMRHILGKDGGDNGMNVVGGGGGEGGGEGGGREGAVWLYRPP
jgi:sugar lactone lactonase YvrE